MAWFHKRSGHEGTGYSIASTAGLMAAIIFCTFGTVIAIGAVIACTRFGVAPMVAGIGAMIVFLVILVPFLIVVRLNSDKTSGGL